MASLLGMALGGWRSGYIFDVSGAYRTAFLNGLGWNAVNGAIVLWLISRRRWPLACVGPGSVNAAGTQTLNRPG